MRALREDPRFVALGAIGLDDPDSAHPFREPPDDRPHRLAPLLEQRARRVERPEEDDGEDDDAAEDDPGQPHIEVEEDARHDRGGDEAAEKLEQTGPDEIADAFRVVDDPRNDGAGLGAVEIRHRQSLHVILQPPAQLGDGALRGHAEDLRQCVTRERRDDRRQRTDRRQLPEHLVMLLVEDVVDQVLRRARHDDAGQTINEQQRDADEQTRPCPPDEIAGVAEQGLDALRVELALLLLFLSHGRILRDAPPRVR